MKYNDTFEFPPTEPIEIDGRVFEIEIHPVHAPLKLRREELHLSQQQAADLAGIKLRQYQRFESGERKLSGASMRVGLAICEVLQLDPNRFRS